GATEPSPVAVVALDRRSLDHTELLAYPRALMAPVWATVTTGLFHAGARAVGFDLLFAYSANQFSPNFDSPFLAAIAEQRERVLLARGGPLLPAPACGAALRNEDGALGLAELISDPDGHYRRVQATYDTVDGGSVTSLAGALLARAKALPIPGEVVLAPRRHLERIPTYAVIDVLRCARQAPDSLSLAFAGKIVLVGGAMPEEDRRISSGWLLRPMRTDAPLLHPCGLRRLSASDPDSSSVPGVFLHAAAIEAVMTGRVTVPAPTI